jgi:deazaflavin-dependent oxidoreductase (nitroreductase family)
MAEQEPSENARRQAMNQAVIDEFRANSGKVGGFAAQIPLLLLHHVGAKSGAGYVTPLAYLEAGEAFVLLAANGGRDRHPGWYHNLLTRPQAEIEVGERRVSVTARVAEGAEWEELAERARQETELFAGFESRTQRRIPILVLEPAGA